MQVKIQVDDARAIVSVHRKDGSLVGQIEEVKPHHKPTVVTVTPDEYVMVMVDEDRLTSSPA